MKRTVLRFHLLWLEITECRNHLSHTFEVKGRFNFGRIYLFGVLVVLLFSTAALAQSIPDSPSFERTRFLDRQNVFLLTSLTAFQALDAYKTDQTLAEGGRETWPVARHFCQSRPGRVGYFWASYTATIASSYLLHRQGHRKLARMALIAGTVSAASGFAYTLAHTR